MFVIEPQSGQPIVADTPEEAIKLYKARMMTPHPLDTVNFHVWDSYTGEFFVVAVKPGEEYEKIIYFSKEERERLVRRMMELVVTCDDALKQVCQLAALNILDLESYENWMGETDAKANS